MAFLGLSSSIVNQVGSTVSGWVKNPLNRNFFYWYFFPALAFIFFNSYLIGPFALNRPGPDIIKNANEVFAPAEPSPDGSFQDPNAQPDASLDGSGLSAGDYFVGLLISFLGVDLLYFILVPFFMGIGLNAVAFQLTRFFEGFVWPLNWLLAPLKARNTTKSKELYGGLFDKRLEYLRLYRLEKKLAKAEAEAPPSPPPLGKPAFAPEKQTSKEMREQMSQLKRAIQKLHEGIEAKDNARGLPSDLGRVTPTALGNVLAVAEEYPFDRYGMDSVLFWPRLRAELDEATLQPLDSAKGMVDGLLNLSLLAYVAAVEAVVMGVIVALNRAPVAPATQPLVVLFGSGVLALALGYFSYRGAVNAAEMMGSLLKTFFDYHRDKILEKFGLKRPDALEDEKVIWFKLGAFLRRGESFYFPEEAEMD
ncbi:MAG: hypothetical protein HYZ49_18040 [Chloroflexi bacterium]|nr:hypothetical protein [Chloroflexota bacterium]